ncbi:hypothetical protein, partial [Kistimonas scapharcae]|uniref:hypothetical protein n=1 Tax=Kistimonas scapharcae TaxID=1036133 RepID=UPI0031ECA732
ATWHLSSMNRNLPRQRKKVSGKLLPDQVRVEKEYQVVDQTHYEDVSDFVGGLDNVLSQSTLDFQVEDGGPHCLTQEIVITDNKE